MVCPCKECGSRTEICHCNCQRYGAWAAERVRIREARIREKENHSMREGLRKSLVRKAARQRQGREK